MRYHTAPIIAFAAFLERERYYSGDSHYFQEGNKFSCYVSRMRIEKKNALETSRKDRQYSDLSFKYTNSGYKFKLSPGGFLSKTPTGIVKFSGGNEYSLERDSDYEEKWVKFKLQPSSGSFSGTYYNWHMERGKFIGYVSGKNIEITASGYHYKRKTDSLYHGVTDVERFTTWEFDIALSHFQLPT